MKAIFLDRDGTLNKDINYLTRKEEIDIFPGVKKALKMFKKLGFLNIVITNQSVVAHGLLTIEELEEIHNEFRRLLTYGGKSLIDDIFYSPYHIDGIVEEFKVDSIYRKPGTGMILDAQLKYDIDLNESWLIGDSLKDMQCAENAGLKKILVLTGYGKQDLKECEANNLKIDYVAKNLIDAAKYVKKQYKKIKEFSTQQLEEKN
ncbi:MAG: HAD family hydrolase [Ignavibacteria bacterium]|nr:HAD family hydrolase [Ignavibacteria bacterium]